MWNPFKSKPLLSENDSVFQLECYKWLLKHFGEEAFYKDTALVLPTKEYFPAKVDSKEGAVQYTFERVKELAGMGEWPCRLEEQEEEPNTVVAPTIVVRNASSNPLGTISKNESNEVVITYNPKITSDPTQMVATFAHELSHYLTGTAPEAPPGGWGNWEFATDIGATFMGFGIFMANSAFSFRQYTDVNSQGWQTTGGGYLSLAEYSYALAIFLKLKELPYESAATYCRPNIKVMLKRAFKEIDKTSIIEELRGTVL